MISIFKDINKFAGRWEWLDKSAIFCARVLPYFLVIFLLIFSVINKKWEIFIVPLFSAFVSRFIIGSLIYHFYKEKRPAKLKGTNLLIPVPNNPSFPSSHATVFFAISFSLLVYNTNLALIFLALSLIIGIARVFCGVHYFRDIVGGFVAGLISAGTIYLLLR